MNRTLPLVFAATLLGVYPLMTNAAPEDPPAATPPGLPTGHPSVSMPEKPKASPARSEDVESAQAIIHAYYTSISGAKGETRDWGRFLSLFMDDARFIVPRMVDDEMVPFALSPQKFVDTNHTYFERGGYYEQEIHQTEESFGHIAQVFSTYGSRRALSDPEPYARGINSFQLMKTNGRWWIVSLTWDAERSDINPIPAKYLPEGDQED